ncbi:MAG: hypothetical protein IKN72_03595 [Clostridia bacterium]|nr:hypothetical protein [Clostridia bacterium]
MKTRRKNLTKIIIMLVLNALSIFIGIIIIQLFTKENLKKAIDIFLSSSSNSEIVMVVTLIMSTLIEFIIAFLTILEDRKIILKQQERQKKYIQCIKLLDGKKKIDESNLIKLQQKEMLTQKEMEDIEFLLNASQSDEIDDINSAIDKINYFALCRIQNASYQSNDESA